MKQIFEDAVDQDRFSMASVYSGLEETVFSEPTMFDGLEISFQPEYQQIRDAFTKRTTKKILQGIIRFSFFVEPVKRPKIDSTKYAVRWGSELKYEADDPRFATYDECLSIFSSLLTSLVDNLGDRDKCGLLQLYADEKLSPYELPVDYIERHPNGNIHVEENIQWYWTGVPKKVVALREYLLDGENHDHIKFFKAAYDKVKVKAHLTDRVLTGEHKTNREKRWEAHPNSVHFATRIDCLDIEWTLINQLCYFQGFPEKLRSQLEEEDVISFSKLEDPALKSFDDELMRCPITLEPLSFEEFKLEVIDPEHGKASYQVGHMHPLKAQEDNPYTGHTAKNISWISAQGNRIQGEHAVEETRDFFFSMIRNYKDAGMIE
jgi:hypothetical protein